jgi:hypothetical protein
MSENLAMRMKPGINKKEIILHDRTTEVKSTSKNKSNLDMQFCFLEPSIT